MACYGSCKLGLTNYYLQIMFQLLKKHKCKTTVNILLTSVLKAD